MSELVRTAEDVIEVSYHQFWITEDDDLPTDVGDDGFGLVRLHPGAAAVRTGIASGPAGLRVELHRAAPPLHVEGWDDAVEFTLWSLEGNLHVKALMDWPPEGVPLLAHAGEGAYRIRVHVKGRDNAYDLTVFEPTEQYLIQVWPTEGDEFDPITEHKLTDDVGAQNRTH
jgi:hypothetical protein